MTENSEPIVRLGTQDTEGNVNGQFEVDYATDTGDALLRHISSGAEVRWNQTESRWELNQPTAVEEFLVDRLNSLEQNFIQLQSSLGDETQPVPGTSHFESVEAEVLTNDYLFAGAFEGADADARLDAAISAASDGNTIYLEATEYASDRTVSKRLTIEGGGNRITGANIMGSWTFDESITLCGVGRLTGPEGSLTVNTAHCAITRCYSGPDDAVQVNEDQFRYFGNRGGDITFDSTTSGGIVDACTNTTVTDNGSNNVGDIA